MAIATVLWVIAFVLIWTHPPTSGRTNTANSDDIVSVLVLVACVVMAVLTALGVVTYG